ALRTTRTLAAIEAAAEAGVLDPEDATGLAEAWRFVSRIRNGIVLLRARHAESMVEDAHERAGLAHLLGYGSDHSQEMIEDYRRVTRHARAIVERVFYGP